MTLIVTNISVDHSGRTIKREVADRGSSESGVANELGVPPRSPVASTLMQ
jgi:hypothetical protein